MIATLERWEAVTDQDMVRWQPVLTRTVFLEAGAQLRDVIRQPGPFSPTVGIPRGSPDEA